MPIEINLKNQNAKRKIDLSKAGIVAEKALRLLKKNNISLNIIFVSNSEIRKLNSKYLGRETSTDVIAFSGDGIKVEEKGFDFFGDIAISSDKALENAGSYGTTFTEEIVLYVIHGILHLAGYDDITDKERAVMKEKEDEFFQKIRKII